MKNTPRAVLRHELSDKPFMRKLILHLPRAMWPRRTSLGNGLRLAESGLSLGALGTIPTLFVEAHLHRAHEPLAHSAAIEDRYL